MKLSNLILLTIVSVAIFYIQLWDDRIVTPLHLSLLGVCVAYAIYSKSINMAHIASFILVCTVTNRLVFETGLINDVTPADNALLQSLLIYGTNLLFSLILTLVLIFRVQLSRMLSNSKNIELTHFDGIFHWIFIYMVVINLLILLEDMALILFDMKSWTLIYDNFEGLVYVGWALCCGTLLTMMIVEAKSNRSGEANAL
ncbi:MULTISPECIES: hypothetical protein [Pseudoalteromonas]|uniref:Uncharacterized protein n=1 Tax=Pseudoalteromonas amylolytica TaxID=1859457 RepID=A0A1S1N2D9_9GAMM|nr:MULTISPECIES: hypothetical protein [Pseudoalteromonas]OHU90605.1 hypothetical protein BFC16_03090 [Pseudoalteromonas sp. JW3]OHU92774.1 hypothetical protein BET10_04805 [Pseudoalteromonas amylolytica]